MRSKVRETELKTIFKRIDGVQLNEADKRQAKDYLRQADQIAERVLRIAAGLKRLTGLVIARAARRATTHVSRPAN